MKYHQCQAVCLPLWTAACPEGSRSVPLVGEDLARSLESSVRMPVASKPAMQRLRIALRGAVQGVGFRPFVYRLATEMSLTGWVLNSSAGLVVEVEGTPARLRRFEQRIESERPEASV